MYTLVMLILGAALAFTACASQEKDWMKLDGRATLADLRRDHAACSKAGSVDEDCMRNRGWIAVSPGVKVEKPPEPARPGPPTGITTR